MPTYRSVNLKGGTIPGKPPTDNVIARRVATQISVHQQMSAQDRIQGSGRRVISGQTLGARNGFWIPDSDPETLVADPDYPDDSTEYVIARLKDVHWTAGYMPKLHIVCLPTGATQKFDDVSDWGHDTPIGRIKVVITFTNEDSTTTTVTREIDVEPSDLDNEQKPQGAGDCWGAIVLDEALFQIDDFENDPSVRAAWTGPFMTAEVTISRVGSIRVVDRCLYEEPWNVTRDTSDTNWPTHLYAEGGIPYDAYPHTYPVEESSTSDPVAGMEHLIETARQQGFQLGPCLGFRSSWDESSATPNTVLDGTAYDGNGSGTGDNEAPSRDTSSASFVHWLDDNWSTFAEDLPGIPMGCGGYARHYRTSDQTLVLPNNGVVEVIVGWYGTTGINTGTVRFWVSEYSYIDLAISAGGDGWTFGSGLLECGTGPEDGKTCQLWCKVSGGGATISTRNWGVWYPSNT